MPIRAFIYMISQFVCAALQNISRRFPFATAYGVLIIVALKMITEYLLYDSSWHKFLTQHDLQLFPSAVNLYMSLILLTKQQNAFLMTCHHSSIVRDLSDSRRLFFASSILLTAILFNINNKNIQKA